MFPKKTHTPELSFLLKCVKREKFSEVQHFYGTPKIGVVDLNSSWNAILHYDI